MAELDNTTFRELNGKAELFPGKANYWVAVFQEDLLKLPEVERLERANELVERFLNDYGIDNNEARALDVWPANGIPKGRRYGLVQPQPMTYPDGSVFISFTWDSPEDSETSVNWPWQARFLDWKNVEQGLVAIYQPGSAVDVPDALDNAVYAAQQTAGQIKEELPKLGGDILLWVGVGVASLFALSRAFR